MQKTQAGIVLDADRVDPDELAKFAAIEAGWWDPEGPMRPLHAIGPARLAFIRAEACRHLGRDPAALRPLAGLRALDIGCGGGLTAEPLARMGAEVVAIDPVASSIEAARAHAAAVGVAVDYRQGMAEQLVEAGERFDLVLALEVIEHVPEPEHLVALLAAAVRPGGLVLLSTLNRTWRAWCLAILGAEHLLGLLPRGTHDWHRFLAPSEVARLMRRHGLRTVAVSGIGWRPGKGFELVQDTSVNYMLAARRD